MSTFDVIYDEPEPEPEKPPRRKIIYVDDVTFSLVSMKDRLKPYYEVYPAKSDEELFYTLEKVKPDLILLDVNMPEVNGFDIIERLKASSRFSEIPVIFLTGAKDKQNVIKGMGLGAADVVFKPFTEQDLIDRIEYQFDFARQTENIPIILAVDDNPSILRSINQILHDTYRVYTLPKPEAVTEMLKRLKPDLFLLDLHMPAMSGADLAKTLREMPEYEDTPIVFLTSDATNDSIYAAVGIGADDYIVKPINEAVLREKLKIHLKDYITRRIVRSLLQYDSSSY